MMVPPSAADLAAQGARAFTARTGLAVDVAVKDPEYIYYMATANKRCEVSIHSEHCQVASINARGAYISE